MSIASISNQKECEEASLQSNLTTPPSKIGRLTPFLRRLAFAVTFVALPLICMSMLASLPTVSAMGGARRACMAACKAIPMTLFPLRAACYVACLAVP
jgi:hypothetical protein